MDIKMASSFSQNRTRLLLPIKGNQNISVASVSRCVSYSNKIACRTLTRRDISFLKN